MVGPEVFVRNARYVPVGWEDYAAAIADKQQRRVQGSTVYLGHASLFEH